VTTASSAFWTHHETAVLVSSPAAATMLSISLKTNQASSRSAFNNPKVT
jgi:hypothetical protein